MRANVTIFCVAAALAGCGGASTSNQFDGILAVDDSRSDEAPAGMQSPVRMLNEVATANLTPDPSLPDAPWATEHMAAGDVPNELLSAWQNADNRERCALLAPSELDGVRARRADFDGGWAVEFDKNGLPGVSANGNGCRSCGRGAFGIAGTAISIDDEDPMEAEERGFADGSLLRLEAPLFDEEDTQSAVGHVASLKIRGQDCVYQVWSFAGDDHLDALIDELRFVETR